MYPDFKLSGVPLARALRARLCAARGATDRTAYTRVQPTRAPHEERGGPAPRARSLLYAIRIIDFQVRYTQIYFGDYNERGDDGIYSNFIFRDPQDNNIERQVRAT